MSSATVGDVQVACLKNFTVDKWENQLIHKSSKLVKYPLFVMALTVVKVVARFVGLVCSTAHQKMLQFNVFVDPEIRPRLNDRNYRDKLIEDVEMARDAVTRLLPKTLLESLEGVIALGKHAILFGAKIKTSSEHVYKDKKRVMRTYHYTIPGVVKIWNVPAKQLQESKIPFYEDDLEFLELLDKSPETDFRELWAEREMKILERLSQIGVKCAKGIACVKNVLIMSPMGPTIGQQESSFDPKNQQNAFENAVLTMKHLYTNGLIHTDLSEQNTTSDGSVYDVYRIVSRECPDAENFLLKSCSKFFQLIKPLELKAPESSDSMFFEIIGIKYASKKP